MTRTAHPAPESWDEATDVRRFWWLIAPLTFALLTAGVAAFTGELRPDTTHEKSDRSERAFDLRGTGAISIENAWGPVTVERHDEATVKVTVERTATGRSDTEAEQGLNSLRLQMTQDGDQVSIRNYFNSEIAPANVSATVHVLVPKRADLTISTGGGGDVVVRGIDGNMLIRNGQDGIQVEMPQDAAFDIRANVLRVRSSFVLTQQAPIGAWAFRAVTSEPPQRVLQISAHNGDLLLTRET